MRHHPDAHTDWCARAHHCGLGEHRSAPIVVDHARHGRAVLTRVRGANGPDQAEIRLRVALSPAEPVARRQLSALLREVDRLLTRSSTTAIPGHSR